MKDGLICKGRHWGRGGRGCIFSPILNPPSSSIRCSASPWSTRLFSREKGPTHKKVKDFYYFYGFEDGIRKEIFRQRAEWIKNFLLFFFYWHFELTRWHHHPRCRAERPRVRAAPSAGRSSTWTRGWSWCGRCRSTWTCTTLTSPWAWSSTGAGSPRLPTGSTKCTTLRRALISGVGPEDPRNRWPSRTARCWLTAPWRKTLITRCSTYPYSLK